MNGSPLHRAFLTLWDKARDCPSYDRREWMNLQGEILNLEARLKIARTALADAMMAEARDRLNGSNGA